MTAGRAAAPIGPDLDGDAGVEGHVAELVSVGEQRLHTKHVLLSGCYHPQMSFARTFAQQFGIAPQGLSAFAVSTKIDQVLADLSTGVDVINATGIVMRLQYEGRFAQDLQQNSVNLKGSVPF